ncbi:hypothetical protein EYF80_029163 [Liparis tanakae]|uniref:Uncharacterized protein n=1 Tax=Liparis tanakae TaxID=230148 RepID=A0A4Z2H6P9_9TELE|nr:hypothetical protein EYF80_029163 [Liparis tanakae]
MKRRDAHLHYEQLGSQLGRLLRGQLGDTRLRGEDDNTAGTHNLCNIDTHHNTYLGGQDGDDGHGHPLHVLVLVGTSCRMRSLHRDSRQFFCSCRRREENNNNNNNNQFKTRQQRRLHLTGEFFLNEARRAKLGETGDVDNYDDAVDRSRFTSSLGKEHERSSPRDSWCRQVRRTQVRSHCRREATCWWLGNVRMASSSSWVTVLSSRTGIPAARSCFVRLKTQALAASCTLSASPVTCGRERILAVADRRQRWAAITPPWTLTFRVPSPERKSENPASVARSPTKVIPGLSSTNALTAASGHEGGEDPRLAEQLTGHVGGELLVVADVQVLKNNKSIQLAYDGQHLRAAHLQPLELVQRERAQPLLQAEQRAQVGHRGVGQVQALQPRQRAHVRQPGVVEVHVGQGERAEAPQGAEAMADRLLQGGHGEAREDQSLEGLLRKRKREL